MKKQGFKRWLEDRITAQVSDEEQKRRSLFTGFFLCLSLLFMVAVTAVNFGYLIFERSPETTLYLVEDLTIVGLLCVILFLNRRGHIHLSAILFVGVSLGGTAISLPGDDQLFSILFFSFSIQIASYILRPSTSILVAILTAIFYGLLHPGIFSADPVLVLIVLGLLFFSAGASWFVSSQLRKALREARKSEQKYVSLLEKSPFCVFAANGSQAGGWGYLSPRIEDLLGFSVEEWLSRPGRWSEQLYPEDLPWVMAEIDRTLNQGLAFHAEYRMFHRSGRVIWVSDDTVPTPTLGEPNRVEGALLDITDHRRAEQVREAAYRISQATFSANDLGGLYRLIHAVLGELMDARNFFIALYDSATDMLEFPYFVDQYDEPPRPAVARHGLTEYVLRTARPIFATREKCVELVAQGEITDVGAPSVDWLGVPLIISDRPIGVMAVQSYTEGVRFTVDELNILQFVSTQAAMAIDRKRTEAELREATQLNGEVISGVNTGIIVYDRDLRHQIWNPYMEQMTGIGKEKVLNRSAMELFQLFQRDPKILKNFNRALDGAVVSFPDTRFEVASTGKTGWFSGYCGPHRNAQGQTIGVIAVINEITERKKGEDALRSMISEKEVLVREIHHRVKNNLQVMSSLISLQADTVQNPEVQASFREMQTRVRTMALIHEELYQAKDLSRVNFAEYIQKLASGLMQAYLMNPHITLNIDIDDIYLSVDTAIPCGLIINELVTNALKYAFPGDRAGEVLIQLRSAGDATFSLVVQDNGVGLPPGIDIENTQTLGMQLITILTRQLRGKISVCSEAGTRFQIDFSGYSPEKF